MSPTKPGALERLIDHLGQLPGIGKRSAERIALHLLRQPSEATLELADAIRGYVEGLAVCSVCGNIAETDPCPICEDPERDRTTLLVVEQPSDVATIEQTGSYRGLYHVLMGRLAPLDGIGAGDLNIDGLIHRVRRGSVKEVVIATNPTLEGDGTALLLQERLEPSGVAVSRLARGVPIGTNLATVSKAVLCDAIAGRTGMAG